MKHKSRLQICTLFIMALDRAIPQKKEISPRKTKIHILSYLLISNIIFIYIQYIKFTIFSSMRKLTLFPFLLPKQSYLTFLH
jgi:hypothetical protein